MDELSEMSEYEKRKAYIKAYYIANRYERLAYFRAYYRKHRERLMAYGKAFSKDYYKKKKEAKNGC